MSSGLNEVRGVRGAPSARVPSGGGSGRTGAIVPVAPTDNIVQPDSRTPLGGSGVSVDALLETSDHLAVRAPVTQGAMSMGLEQARMALLKDLPVDALAALDDVWTGARHTEEGWYLRAGALAVLGLPGEGDRVAAEGLEARPSSLALRFMQALSRSLGGDFIGARMILAGAVEVAPDNPVLKLLYAVNQAHQGHREQAETMVGEVMRRFPTHPAVEWARQAVRSVVAERTRGNALDTVRMPSGEYATVNSFSELAGRADDVVADVVVDVFADSLRSALVSLGSRLVVARRMREDGGFAEGTSLDESVRELLRALSAGGALSGASGSAESHAARTILGQLLQNERSQDVGSNAGIVDQAVRSDGTPGVLRQMLGHINGGDYAQAARLWRRLEGQVPSAMRSVIRCLFEGMKNAAEGNPAQTRSGHGYGDKHSHQVLHLSRPGMRFGRESGALQPIRFGLALLNESETGSMIDAARRPSEQRLWNVTPGAGAQGIVADLGEGSVIGHPRPVPGEDAGGIGGGIAEAGWAISSASVVPSVAPIVRSSSASEGSLRLMAVICIVLALTFGVLNYSAAAVAFGAGAAWLGLRSRGRAEPNEGDSEGHAGKP